MPLNFPKSSAIVPGTTYSGSNITWTWDGAKWTAFGRISMDDLADVIATDSTAEDILVYDGTDWQTEPKVNGGTY